MSRVDSFLPLLLRGVLPSLVGPFPGGPGDWLGIPLQTEMDEVCGFVDVHSVFLAHGQPK